MAYRCLLGYISILAKQSPRCVEPLPQKTGIHTSEPASPDGTPQKKVRWSRPNVTWHVPVDGVDPKAIRGDPAMA